MQMDETHEEMEEIRRHAAKIDVHHYRNRFRLLKAIGLGMLGAGAVALVLRMLDDRRNPCERVHEYLCKKGTATECSNSNLTLKLSVEDASGQMRGNIRAQCVRKIERLKAEDGIDVP